MISSILPRFIKRVFLPNHSYPFSPSSANSGKDIHYKPYIKMISMDRRSATSRSHPVIWYLWVIQNNQKQTKFYFFVIVLVSMTHRYQITGWDLDVALLLSTLIILIYGLLGLSQTLRAVGVLNWLWFLKKEQVKKNRQCMSPSDTKKIFKNNFKNF